MANLNTTQIAHESEGNSMLFVGDEEADSAQCTFGNPLNAEKVLSNIRVGIGTASGGNFAPIIAYVTANAVGKLNK